MSTRRLALLRLDFMAYARSLSCMHGEVVSKASSLMLRFWNNKVYLQCLCQKRVPLCSRSETINWLCLPVPHLIRLKMTSHRIATVLSLYHCRPLPLKTACHLRSWLWLWLSSYRNSGRHSLLTRRMHLKMVTIHVRGHIKPLDLWRTFVRIL